MLNRRTFTQLGVLTGATALFMRSFDGLEVFGASSLRLEPFVDPLPIPRRLLPRDRFLDADYYEATMTESAQRLHRDLSPTLVWGYEGSYPGPTIEVKRGRAAMVQWKNRLPARHLLPVDNAHGATPKSPLVRNVVHLRGGRVAPDSDGRPEEWLVPGQSRLYHYPNGQRAAALWYHDHAAGLSQLNVYAGLSGLYLIRDEDEEELSLPAGPYEIPLLIQDRSFDENGRLHHPTSARTAFFGDKTLVNGKVWPYLDVEPRPYRFRVVNGANARVFRMRLRADAKGAQRPSFYQIGGDGGLLSRPVESDELLLAPGERADVIIDFSTLAGSSFVLHNDAVAPFEEGKTCEGSRVMQFRVTKPLASWPALVPKDLMAIELLRESQATRVRDLAILRDKDALGNPMTLIDGHRGEVPSTGSPRRGSTEVWRFVNTTGDTHPMHLHLVMFQILDRRPFDVKRYQDTGEIVFTGPAVPAAPGEAGWKDTVRATPGHITRIIVRFDGLEGAQPYPDQAIAWNDRDETRPYEVMG